MMEFRSQIVTVNENDQYSNDKLGDTIQRTCNAWAKEGWEVFSVIVPQPSNWSTYRLTAKRDFGAKPFQESLI
jgi:hypothetical protein